MSSFLDDLISMGFDENIARIAIQNNQNGTIDDAINWILSSSENIEDQSNNNNNNSNSDNNSNNMNYQENLKLVLVVRSDLQMTSGKMAAQCVHAALAVVRIVEVQNPIALQIWRYSGEATICLRCSNEDELNSLESCASSIGLPTSVVHDAGRTQVAPNTRTVLAIGPAPVSQIDSLTRHLKLY